MELRSLPAVLLAPLAFVALAEAAPGPQPGGVAPPPPPLAGATEEAAPPEPATSPVPPPTPVESAQATVPPAAPQEPSTDHERVVGHLGIGYLATPTLVVGAGIDGSTAEVEAPVLGVRYWFRPHWGFDAGLGVVVATDRVATPAGQAKAPPASGAVLHLGLPWSITSGKHYSFQLLPEANVGFASQTVTVDGLADLENGGFHVDLGARAGAELQFGFMGIPELSLQGNVGARWDYDSTTSKQGGEEASTSAFRFATVPYGDPWDLFTGSIAALYYL